MLRRALLSCFFVLAAMIIMPAAPALADTFVVVTEVRNNSEQPITINGMLSANSDVRWKMTLKKGEQQSKSHSFTVRKGDTTSVPVYISSFSPRYETSNMAIHFTSDIYTGAVSLTGCSVWFSSFPNATIQKECGGNKARFILTLN